MSKTFVAACAVVIGLHPCRAAYAQTIPPQVVDSGSASSGDDGSDSPLQGPTIELEKQAQVMPGTPQGPLALPRPPAAPPDHFVWKQHPSLRFGNALRVDFQARFLKDLGGSYAGSDVTELTDTFNPQRARVGVQGTLFKRIDFEVERLAGVDELTPEEQAAGLVQKSPWKDVYLDVDFANGVQLKGGKFKVPFGLDALSSQTENDFAYRTLGAAYLAPGRDIGVMLHGRFFKRALNYSAGVFEHDGEHARAKSIAGGDQTIAGRVAASPFQAAHVTALTKLELGVAYARTNVAEDRLGPNGLRGRTVLTEDVFFSPVYVNGFRNRWETDVDWLVGPASIRGEYTYVTDDRDGQSIEGATLPDARYRSWYAGGTYLLTGESKERPVRPKHDFLRGGIGAVELAGRYERIWYDSADTLEQTSRSPRATSIEPSGEFVTTMGVNWFVNRWVTFQVNLIREQLADPARSPVPDAQAFWSRVLRLRVSI